MTTAVLDELLSAPCPIATPARLHAADIRPGDVILVGGEAREVTGRARALDGTLDLATRDGNVNMHPYRRVSLA